MVSREVCAAPCRAIGAAYTYYAVQHGRKTSVTKPARRITDPPLTNSRFFLQTKSWCCPRQNSIFYSFRAPDCFDNFNTTRLRITPLTLVLLIAGTIYVLIRGFADLYPSKRRYTHPATCAIGGGSIEHSLQDELRRKSSISLLAAAYFQC